MGFGGVEHESGISLIHPTIWEQWYNTIRDRDYSIQIL